MSQRRADGGHASKEAIRSPSNAPLVTPNLPSLLNDPNRGKQKDFFTRHWGESFTDARSIPPSPYVCELPPKCFDRYLKKIRKHERHQPASPSTLKTQHDSNLARVSTDVSRVFLDPNFDLSRPETFKSIFNISQNENFTKQVKSSGPIVQEQLSHQLDLVEVSIAHQVAQKSHHFFQVMTYHDALMTQLKTLVRIIQTLRYNLKSVDDNSLKPAIELLRLKRRYENLAKVLAKLPSMSSLHQFQPAIQLQLSSSDFSGALDLITTSNQILSVELKGIKSFQHLKSHLEEMKEGIGKKLLKDFKSFIEAEMTSDIVHVKATSLTGDYSSWIQFDPDKYHSLIYGLLRQNSFDFLESLEEASVAATKKTLQDVVWNIIGPNVSELSSDGANISSSAALITVYSKACSSHEWLDLFDVMSGSVLVLLNRIYEIIKMIKEAIESLNSDDEDGSNNPLLPEQQKQNLLESISTVYYNICDQMNERLSKYLSFRSKTDETAKLITVEELTSIGLIVSIFCEESRGLGGDNSNKLQLCHKSQSVMYVKFFDDDNRDTLNTIVDSEHWKRSESDFSGVIAKLVAIPSLRNLFPDKSSAYSKTSTSIVNGVHQSNKKNGTPSASPSNMSESMSVNSSEESNRSHSDQLILPAQRHEQKRALTGQVVVNGQNVYVVNDCVGPFLKMLAEYCNLGSMLPAVTTDVGLKAAELIKFFNSRICQLLIGAGAINVTGLKTITIQNLALASRSVQLVKLIVPYVLHHFEECHAENSQLPSIKAVNGASPGATKAEKGQLEAVKKQFDKAVMGMKDHVDEINKKVIAVVSGSMRNNLSTWQPSKQIPSANFKALCKLLNKLHDSTEDVWPKHDIEVLFMKIHTEFLEAVRYEIRVRNLHFDSAKARALQSEMTFYGQCLLRLDYLPISELSRERFETLWRDEDDL